MLRRVIQSNITTRGKPLLFNTFYTLFFIIVTIGCGYDSQSRSNDSNEQASVVEDADEMESGAGSESDSSESRPPLTDDNPYQGESSSVFLNSSNWLCHPDLNAPQDVCDGQLDSTVVEADGSSEFVSHPASRTAQDSGVDCFYVYPTVSEDATPNSDRFAGPQERQTTAVQFGRYRSLCRPFAPVYQQLTLPFLQAGIALSAASEEALENAAEIAYQDVLAAFKTYIDNENNGRPFILVGHSQGTIHLRRLIAEEVEKFPYLQQRLVAAHLIGFSVEVPKGEDVGGNFQSVPACRKADQSGCVIAFSSYRAGDPQIPNALFGRASQPNRQAICVNPAALLADIDERISSDVSFLNPQIPRLLPPLFQALVIPRGSGGPYANPLINISFDSYFFSVPEQLKARCTDFNNDVHYLEVTILSDPDDPRADDYGAEFIGGDTWGLHLADMNIVLDDLVNLAERQITHYEMQ